MKRLSPQFLIITLSFSGACAAPRVESAILPEPDDGAIHGKGPIADRSEKIYYKHAILQILRDDLAFARVQPSVEDAGVQVDRTFGGQEITVTLTERSLGDGSVRSGLRYHRTIRSGAVDARRGIFEKNPPIDGDASSVNLQKGIFIMDLLDPSVVLK
ncbi:MAG: hypothetical protein HY286_15910 [Planctomycetes bacterium]|nr:hypothetical protein [Planctomycetota bacterium]